MIAPDLTEIGGRSGDTDRARKLSRELPRVGITDGGWSALHFDPDDGRLWEFTFPEGHLHGGGPPLMHVLSEAEAREKYGESTMADPRLSQEA
ncbi:MAG: hypothetical protein BRD46_03260 [Bacteroidetes bacterium QS_8_68_15]|nr:MAG: hypothetical protein BRD46_03260 [Bacteroidetes bacterium QS_8_68_15]